MAIELDAWLKTTPEAPDLEKRRKAGTNLSARFTICGEGECIRALFTIYSPGKTKTRQHRPGQMGEVAVTRLTVTSAPQRPMVLHAPSVWESIPQSQDKLRSLPA
jgi:hypothetical protein